MAEIPITIPTRNNGGIAGDVLIRLVNRAACRRGNGLVGITMIGAKRYGASEEQSKREEREVRWTHDHRKPVVTTKLPGVMKESGEGCGVVYVGKSEDALWRAVRVDRGRGGWGVWTRRRGGLLRNITGMMLWMGLRGFWRM